jgi:hypothetical protein
MMIVEILQRRTERLFSAENATCKGASVSALLPPQQGPPDRRKLSSASWCLPAATSTCAPECEGCTPYSVFTAIPHAELVSRFAESLRGWREATKSGCPPCLQSPEQHRPQVVVARGGHRLEPRRLARRRHICHFDTIGIK